MPTVYVKNELGVRTPIQVTDKRLKDMLQSYYWSHPKVPGVMGGGGEAGRGGFGGFGSPNYRTDYPDERGEKGFGPGGDQSGVVGPDVASHADVIGIIGSLGKLGIGDVPGAVKGIFGTALNNARGINSITNPTHLGWFDNMLGQAIYGYSINQAKDEYSGLASANAGYGSSGNIGSGFSPSGYGGYEGAMFGGNVGYGLVGPGGDGFGPPGAGEGAMGIGGIGSTGDAW